jgi:polyisoprenoid-binding protein YceI
MNGRKWPCLVACVSCIVLVPAVVPAGADAPVPAASMAVDSVHSSVVFRVKHMDVAWFYGSFQKIAGEFKLDEQNPAGSSVSIEIDAESVDTNDDKRDLHLKGPDFFSVKEFPKITLKAKTASKKGGDWEVPGELTMHGVTKPVTLVVKPTGMIDDPRMGKKAGFETEFTIKRSDFGMTYGIDKKALGDEVKVMVSIEAAVKG